MRIFASNLRVGQILASGGIVSAVRLDKRKVFVDVQFGEDTKIEAVFDEREKVAIKNMNPREPKHAKL